MERSPEFSIDPVQLLGAYGILRLFKKASDLGIIVSEISVPSKKAQRAGRAAFRDHCHGCFKIAGHHSRPYRIWVQGSDVHLQPDAPQLRLNIDRCLAQPVSVPHKCRKVKSLAVSVALSLFLNPTGTIE